MLVDVICSVATPQSDAVSFSRSEWEHAMRRITDVRVLGRYRLGLEFDDGTRGTVDLSELAGKGVFECWREHGAFERVRIGSSVELVWNNQVDLCPDALYLKLTGKKPEDVFPSLRREPARA